MRVGYESFPLGNGLLSVATNLCECVCMCVFQFLWVTGDSCESSTRPGLVRQPIIDLYTRILINVAHFYCPSPSLSLPLCILVYFYLFLSVSLSSTLSPTPNLITLRVLTLSVCHHHRHHYRHVPIDFVMQTKPNHILVPL